MWSVILLIFGVHQVSAELHSLQYFYTGTTGLPDFPQFVAVGIVDGKQIDYYDSVIGKNVLKQAWMEGKRDENRITEVRRGHQENFAVSVKIVKDRFNQTFGIHTFQHMYSCDWDDETGATDGFEQFGYDGEDFLALSLKEYRFISPVTQGFITQQKWNDDSALLQYKKQYFGTECIEWLKKYVQFEKSSPKKADAPKVSLLQKDSSSPVICHATGFYPSNIMMTWKKNQDDHNEDVDVSSTLPNEDGSFQKSISLSVKPEEWKKNQDAYRCVVQHVGGEKVVLLNEENIMPKPASNNIIAIVVGCFVALAVLAAIIGVIVWKKSNGYGKASTNDSDSENSGQPLPKA